MSSRARIHRRRGLMCFSPLADSAMRAWRAKVLYSPALISLICFLVSRFSIALGFGVGRQLQRSPSDWNIWEHSATMNEKKQTRVYFVAPRDAIANLTILGRARHNRYDLRGGTPPAL
jgi:hypothetical protein